jgi:hypothetical protein
MTSLSDRFRVTVEADEDRHIAILDWLSDHNMDPMCIMGWISAGEFLGMKPTEGRSCSFIFENPEDAMLFKLAWHS